MAKKQRHVRINPVARAPILRKGGVHEKSNSAKRQGEKHQLRKLLDKVGAGYGPADLMRPQTKRAPTVADALAK